MKHLSSPRFLTGISLLGGLLCLLARQWLFSTGVDSKGLLLTWHPGSILSCLIAAAVLLLMAAAFIRHRGTYRLIASPLSTLGTLIRALGFGIVAWQLLRQNGILFLICGVFAALSALCAAFIALRQHKRLPELPALHFPGVVLMIVLLLANYQDWSAEPELQRLVFPLLALIALTLSAYYRAALHTELGSWKHYLPLSRACIFLCIACVAGTEHGLFFGIMALSLLMDGCCAVEDMPQEEPQDIPEQAPQSSHEEEPQS